MTTVNFGTLALDTAATNPRALGNASSLTLEPTMKPVMFCKNTKGATLSTTDEVAALVMTPVRTPLQVTMPTHQPSIRQTR